MKRRQRVGDFPLIVATGEAREALDRKVDVLLDRAKTMPTNPVAVEYFGWVVKWKGANFAPGRIFGRREMGLKEFRQWESEYNGFVSRLAAAGLDMTNVENSAETIESPGPGGGPSSLDKLTSTLLWVGIAYVLLSERRGRR